MLGFELEVTRTGDGARHQGRHIVAGALRGGEEAGLGRDQHEELMEDDL